MPKNNFYELNSARNCFRVIIKSYGIKEIYIPYYICPVMWQACRAENCRVKFYHIDENFVPLEDFEPDEYILYPNYFGICSKQVFELAKKYPNLIVDNAHSYFMNDCGLASFTSYRKFFDVADGAGLYIKKEINLPKDDYYYNSLPKNYDEFVQNEMRLNHKEPEFISDCTKNILNKIGFETERIKRLSKFFELHEKLKSSNKLHFELTEFDVPFVYPYLSNSPLNIETFRYWSPLPKNFPEYQFYKYLQPIELNNYPL